MKVILIFLAFATLAALLIASCSFSRFGYESAAYSSSTQSGAFEIRDYPELVVASTPMRGREGSDEAFMRLFRYISEENEPGTKIAMTTPVFSMSAGQDDRMSFMLPEALAESPPQPTSPDVRIETLPAGRFAVYRYSGRWNEAKAAEAEKKLRAWVQSESLNTTGDIVVANYDPPFTPAPLRRNEVLLRLAE